MKLARISVFFFLISIEFLSNPQEESSFSEYMHRAKEAIHNNKKEDAKNLLEKALALDPTSCDAYFHLGNLAFQDQDIKSAISYYKKASDIEPSCAEIYCNLGICANVQGDLQSAIDYFSKAAAMNPKISLAHVQLGLLFEKQKKYVDALYHLNQAYRNDPTNIEIIFQIGALLREMDRFDEAAPYYRIAYAQRPDDLRAIIELANVLSTIDADDEAIELYYKALIKKPDLTGALHNFGFTLKKLGYVDAAIQIYKKAISLKPDYALAHFSLALAYLSVGDFEHGLPKYEWRWAAYDEKPKEFSQPRWDGSASLNKKRLYIYAEQGFGDTFQFIRYLPLLKQRGAYVIFHTQSPLEKILRMCPYIDELVTYRDPLPVFDFHVSLLSLPLLFGTTLETIPADIPYLFADAILVREWKNKLSADTNCKIGICWQGNAQYETSLLRRTVAAKSCPLRYFQLLSYVPNTTFYSLQKMYGLDQLVALNGHSFLHIFDIDFDESRGRFMDTAALIKNLDLVITIDTSIAHFAAALGTPTWVILPEPADWRWMYKRLDTPWYPNIRLFRQPKRGDWEGVMRIIKNALQEFLFHKGHENSTLMLKETRYSIPYDTAVTQRLCRYIITLYKDGSGESTCSKLSLAYALYDDLINNYV